MIDLFEQPSIDPVGRVVKGRDFKDKRPKKKGKPRSPDALPTRPSNRSAVPKLSPERLQQMRAHYLANKEKYVAKAKRWIAEHPERANEFYRENERRRRTRKALGLDNMAFRAL